MSPQVYVILSTVVFALFAGAAAQVIAERFTVPAAAFFVLFTSMAGLGACFLAGVFA